MPVKYQIQQRNPLYVSSYLYCWIPATSEVTGFPLATFDNLDQVVATITDLNAAAHARSIPREFRFVQVDDEGS